MADNARTSDWIPRIIFKHHKMFAE